ncbi:MAG: hypothetical protein HYZ16_08250 [Bacteroidetes bacterium]|jgi:hypothetical protein|nr:hypothetical protein [Bacteroidota bacterium]
MKKILLLGVLPFLANACQKADFEYDPPKECFEQEQNLAYEGEQDLVDKFKQEGLVWAANCFTPNGQGPEKNEVFKPVFSDLAGFNVKGMTIYSKRKKEVAHTELTDGWDGKLEDGSIKNGQYIFGVALSYTDKRQIMVYGPVCVRTCFKEKEDRTGLRFPDTIHPIEGFVFTTEEEIVFCE